MGRAILLVLALAIAVSGQDMAQETGADAVSDFEKDVLPILQSRCFECHSALKSKPKGGLRVDSKAFLLLGGKSGPVIVAGQPGRSPLYTRCSLPDDHDDVMPPSGEVLSKEDLGRIRDWIAAGAPFGDWTGKGDEAKPAVTRTPEVAGHTRERLAVFRELEKEAAEAPGAAVKAAAEAGARITPVLPGGKLLRVEYPMDPQAITDKQVALLNGLRRQVAILSLARTAASDKSIAAIAAMPNLVRLDLPRTGVTDAGLRALAQAKPQHLRRINLYGTAVTDEGLDTLATLPSLAEVFVWDTKVTEAGAQRLARLRRGVSVRWSRELPPPEPRAREDEDPRRRR